MKRRITYVVSAGDADAVKHVKAPNDDTAVVSGLVASKHVRVRIPAADTTASGIMTLEWARDGLIALPFDPPAQSYTHVDAAQDADVHVVQEWASRLGVPLEAPIETDHWLSWFSFTAPVFSSELGGAFSDLQGADALRISTNPSSGEIIGEAWFTSQEWSETVLAPAEIGVLAAKPTDGEITLHGRVRKLGTDAKSEPLLLHWYPRHRQAPGHVATRLVEPYGLHPTLEIEVDAVAPPLPVCRLFAELVLPPELFIDRYQLDDLPRYDPPSELVAVWGETDLELPVWAVDKGSLGLIQLSRPGTHQIPLHSRYARPDASLELRCKVPAPVVYWSCQDDRMPQRRNLEDREKIGIASVYPLEDTAFYVFSNPDSLEFRVPAIGVGHAHSAEIMTLAVVVLGFLTVLGAIVRKVREPKLKAE